MSTRNPFVIVIGARAGQSATARPVYGYLGDIGDDRYATTGRANALRFEPVDLGPADDTRYKDGARVYGFKVRVAGCPCATCTRDNTP